MGADFSGYATKAGLKCSDGRTITPEAFKHMDGVQIPLVYQHGHNSIDNVLGHAILEARPDGMYTYGYFNSTPNGKLAKEAVEHKDIKAMSIYANQLVEKANQVLHGVIREVSLVLAGANPGAVIDWVQLEHSDGEIVNLTDEAVITTGLELEHADKVTPAPASEPVDDPTVQDIYDSMSEEQKGVVSFIVSEALKASGAAHSDDGEPADDEETEEKPDEEPDDSEDDTTDGEKPDADETDEGDLNHQEGAGGMPRNVFEQQGDQKDAKKTLSHDALKGIMEDAKKPGNTLGSAVRGYALQHGIENMDVLFPDAKALSNTPDFISRRMEWVPGVLNGTRHTPFTRIKSLVADITQDEARALGYIKGSYKKEEWFNVTKRTTGPTTVYKKQKLDRDDIVDIVDFDVVAWMRAEMRMMLEEELARAILIGDGREVDDEDKIKDPMAAASGDGIRSIINENELYATTVNVSIPTVNPDYLSVLEDILRARKYYKGSGSPTFYTTNQVLVEMLLTKDGEGRRYWTSKEELAAALMVSSIVEVEVMETMPDLVGVIVNLADYNVGADRGGEVNLFDDFDIDYNQFKYLIETRISGALVKMKSALVVRNVASGSTLVEGGPTAPSFVASTGVVTIPTQTGVTYKNADTSATLSAGAQTALAAGAKLNVVAVPNSGYYFATSENDTWTFKRPSA